MIGHLRRLWVRRQLDRLEEVDPRLRTYANHRFSVDRGTALDDVRFVVFDTEATGLDIVDSRMLSLAAVGVRGRTIDLADRLELTFAADGVGGRDAAEIHQLVTADVRDGTTEEAGALAFIDYLKNSVIVAHHVGFDVAMVNRVLARLGPVRLYNPQLDTLLLERRISQGPMAVRDPLRARDEDRSLDGLCEKFSLDIPMRHTAAGDALATAQLLVVLLTQARKRGVRTLDALLRN